MRSTTVSTKGQVVIPQELRERYHWGPGTVLEIEEHPGGLFLRPVPDVPRTTLADLVGCAGYTGPARTLEEMDAAIEAEARKRR